MTVLKTTLFYSLSMFLTVLLMSCEPMEKPVTKEEALNLAHRIERSADRREASTLTNLIDEEALRKRIADESGIFPNRDMIGAAVKSFRQGFGSSIIKSLGEDGTYQFVKQYEKDKKQHIIFRLYADRRVNYHDFELIKREEAIKAGDVYIYMSGENISKTLADALATFAKNASQADVEKLGKLQVIKTLVAQGNYEKAAKLYDDMPATLKKQKLFQLIHIQVCSGLSTEKYLNSLMEYKSLFPNDPNMYLMMIDAYVLKKDYPKALEYIDKLDSLIDKDPFQDYERGLVYKMMKDTAHTRECLERLHANMPEFKNGTIELASYYTLHQQPDKAIELYNSMHDSTGRKKEQAVEK